MRLKDNIYDLINTSEIRLKLALTLGVTEMTIRNYINFKSEQLTLFDALKVIREETGLPDSKLLQTEVPA